MDDSFKLGTTSVGTRLSTRVPFAQLTLSKSSTRASP